MGLLPPGARGGRRARVRARRSRRAGSGLSGLPRAYFVCIGNAGRSQMAHALYERLGGEARSAGSRPEPEVHPEVVEVMGELDIDLSGRTPRRIDQADVEWADVVVTMGCGDACPVLPGKRYIDWNLPDPSGRPVEAVRALRDEIQRRVAELAVL